MLDQENWRDQERRRNGGWTLWKEIIGTVIAVAPFALAAFAWGVTIERTQERHATEIANLREARTEILHLLRRIEDDVKVIRNEHRR
jgi:CHASE1-domain containing sensor protein